MRNWLTGILFSLLSVGAAHAEQSALWRHAVKGLDGMPVDIGALRGKVVLLDIWATWCDPCRASLPGYQALERKYGKDGFAVLAITIDEKAEDARAFLAKSEFGFLVGWDPTAEWPKRLKLETMPTAWLIARDGSVHRKHEGFHDGDIEKLEAEIAKLLAAPVSKP